MQAVGVQAHPTFKLGLRPPTPGLVRLRLADYLTGKIPTYPPIVDYLAGLTFGLYGNSTYGVCGPCSLANFVRLVTAKLTGKMLVPTQEAVFDLYRRSGNPNFDPTTGADDNGVNMQVMLNAAVKGGLGGKKILGFAAVDVSNPGELDAAIALFGGLLFGVDLQTAQQSQTDTGTWDYAPSGQWGGHAILAGAFTPDFDEVITWAKPVKLTRAFETHQLSEAWVVILEEHLGDKQFLDGVDIHALAADYEALTGNKFPAVIPPAPTPTPPPTPTPTPTPPPTPVTNMQITLTGTLKTPFGSWPITLTGKGTNTAAPEVSLSFPSFSSLANLWSLVSKYGEKALPIIISGLQAGKSWQTIIAELVAAFVAGQLS